MFKLLSTILLSALALSVTAQTRTLSLDECKQLALHNNAQIETATDAVAEAHEVGREAFTKYFPSVSATGMGFKTNRHVLRLDIGNLMTLGMINDGLLGGITATQPVFAGGQIVNGNKLAHVGEEASRLELERTTDDVIRTTEQYYYNLMSLRRKEQTLESVMQMVDTLRHQVQLYVEAGVAVRNDLLKVDLAHNQYAADMVDLRNGIELSRRLLCQYIGCYGQDIDFQMPEVTPDTAVEPGLIYRDPARAVLATPAYGLLNAQVKAAELRQRMEVGKRLPTVGVGAGLYYGNLWHQHNTFGSVFVAVNIPISDWWGGSHAIRRSRLQLQSARTQREDLTQMLELQLTDYWDKLTAAQRKLEIARLSITQSEENLNMNRNFYRAGTSTITDLLDAQMLYRKSCDEFSEAYFDYCKCRADYLAATSQINANNN